jgi:hypothetical protein
MPSRKVDDFLVFCDSFFPENIDHLPSDAAGQEKPRFSPHSAFARRQRQLRRNKTCHVMLCATRNFSQIF